MYMFDKVLERLGALGYCYSEEKDKALIEEEMGLGEAYILSACNLGFIPKVLEGIYIDIVCGRFLEKRLLDGGLGQEELSGIVESITEGDVTVRYESGKELSEYEKAEKLIRSLTDRENELTANRRFRW